MKIISWITRGLGDRYKSIDLKKFIQHYRPDLVLIQEMKMVSFDNRIIKSLWSSRDISWVSVDSIGRFGDMLIMWVDSKFRSYGWTGYVIALKLRNLKVVKLWFVDFETKTKSQDKRFLAEIAR